MHNSRNYNTRNSGRFNRPGNFISASSTNHHTYEVAAPSPAPAAAPPPPPPPPQPAPCTPQPQPLPQMMPENTIKNEDIEMASESTESVCTESRHVSFKTKLSGVKKISNKERRRRQNALLRRLTSPKNALMCINEMLPNEHIANQFKVEAAAPDGVYYNSGTHNFCAELSLDGAIYKGYGENKLAARNAAAEQAIRDIVLKKMERYSDLLAHQATATIQGAGAGGSSEDAMSVTGESSATGGGGASGRGASGTEGEGGTEALPMIQLLSFALHKLFAEWEGAGHHVPQLRTRQPSQVVPEEESEVKPRPPQPAPAPPPPPPPPSGKQRKPKKIPENASAMHPAMLLTILRPHAAYRELSAEGDKPQSMIFTFAVDVDEQTFVGRASNKKEARKAAARAACRGLLGITFDDDLPPAAGPAAAGPAAAGPAAGPAASAN